MQSSPCAPSEPSALLGSPYREYLYAYPHKSAYRPLVPSPRLTEVWSQERTESLFLYVHVPFCESRCGFCNLFTRARPPFEQLARYVDQVVTQAERVRAAVAAVAGAGELRFAQAAVGGGTPTYLPAPLLAGLLDRVAKAIGFELAAAPMSVETSPGTATPDRLAVLAERGVTRISIGVQSMHDDEVLAVGRRQRYAEVAAALDRIRDSGVPTLNIDLIYGIPGQDVASWESSLRAALRWRPEELYLYPLYVRPLTGLASAGRRGQPGTHADPGWDAQRMALYQHAVDLLHAEGYQQESMRMFRRVDPGPAAAERVSLGSSPAPTPGEVNCQATSPREYHCQEDGMIGLGCGARSYTNILHYSPAEYAVSVPGVRAALDGYLNRRPSDFDVAAIGIALDEFEQRRRWLLKTLLRISGVSAADYHARFRSEIQDDFPMLAELAEAGLLTLDPPGPRLTPAGIAYSDAIGPWLVSPAVRRAMRAFVLH